MRATGHASFARVRSPRSVREGEGPREDTAPRAFVAVVVVEPTRAARVAMALAGLAIPPGILLTFLAGDDDAPLGRAPEVPFALALLGLVVLAVGVYALARGTVRARLLLDHREADALTWSFSPKRPLTAPIDERPLVAEITAGAARDVRFTYGDEPTETVPLA